MNINEPPLVSVIIPAYNVEKYIDKCIHSVLKQSYGNIEIICVSDGSTDNTEQIVGNLANKQTSLKLLSQANSGRGGARNTGMKAANGEYVLFLDADDYLPDNAIAILEKTIRQEHTEYVVGNMRSFRGRKSRPTHGRCFRRYMGCTNLTYSPYIIQDPCICNKLFDANFLQKNNLVFEPRMAKEDFIFSIQAACAATRISIVTDTVYYYRIRADKNDISGSQRLGNQFIKDLFSASKLTDQVIAKLANADDVKSRKDIEVVRMLTNRIPRKLINCHNISEAQSFLEIIREGILTLDKKSLSYFPLKQYLFCNLVMNDKFQQALDIFDSVPEESNYPLFDLKIFKDLDILEDLGSDTLSVIIKKLSKKLTRSQRTLNKVFKPYLQLPLRFGFRLFKKTLGYFKPKKKRLLGRLAGIHVDARFMNAKKQKQIWIIGERFGNYAGDNGFVLFNYLVKNNRDHISPYFVLRKSASQFAKLKRHQGILRYGSPAHLYILLKSDVFLFTDKINDVCPRQFASQLAGKPFSSRTFVMLHHGYMYLKRTSFKNYHRNNFGIPIDAFVANSEKEKKFLVKNSGYDPNQIIVTGFCRFDNLLQYTEKRDYILFFPTWRRGMKEWSEEEFRSSYFFCQIMSLLNHNLLHEHLKKYGLKLRFFLHFNMLQWLNCFNSTNDLIEIQKPETTTVTNLLNHCAMLITDFSTVCFDVAYMGKPVLFYDLGMETEDKYTQGPISENFESEIFGPIHNDQLTLIEDISCYGINNFKCKDEYREKSKLFFKHIDSDNTKRLIERVKNISKSKRDLNETYRKSF